MMTWVRARVEQGDDRGLSLVEVIVAMTLTVLVTGTMIGTVFSSSRAGKVVRSQHDLTQEATVVLNRMTRELREAQAVTTVTNANGPNFSATGNVDMTFDVDFNGNGTIEPATADPERLTYRFDRANNRVLLLADSYSTPIIAGGVQNMTLSFTGRGADWTTFDAIAAGGNGNGLLDGFELRKVDAVQVQLVMKIDGHTQTLNTGVNLRNLTSS
jgi:Tfp pilus assembly protein PilW